MHDLGIVRVGHDHREEMDCQKGGDMLATLEPGDSESHKPAYLLLLSCLHWCHPPEHQSKRRQWITVGRVIHLALPVGRGGQGIVLL